MASDIAFISGMDAAADSVTLGAGLKASDLILVWAYRTANTAPSLPAGYTGIFNASGNGNSMRYGYKFSDGSETTSGTWTNATHVAAHIYRNVIKIGQTNPNAGNSNSIDYSTLASLVADGRAWVVGFAGHLTATDVTNAPASMTNRSGATGGGTIGGHDTNGPVTSWTVQSVTVNASSFWRSTTIELFPQVVAPIEQFVQSGGLVGQRWV